MTAEQLRRSVENALGPEVRLPGFLDIASHALSRIRAFGNLRDGWSFDFTKAAFNSEAQYADGTVDVTQGSTAVSGNGTTWTGVTLDRHKLRIGGVDYPIASITDDDDLVLADEYAGETASAQNYAIIKDEFVLPAMSSLHCVWDASNDRRVAGIAASELGNYAVIREGGDKAACYSLMGRASGNAPILQLFPAPLAVARFEYWYQADYTRIADIGDTIDVPSDYDDVVRQGAIARAKQTLRMPDWRDEHALFEQMMVEAWFQDRPQREKRVRMMRLDGADRDYWRLPGYQEVSV